MRRWPFGIVQVLAPLRPSLGRWAAAVASLAGSAALTRTRNHPVPLRLVGFEHRQGKEGRAAATTWYLQVRGGDAADLPHYVGDRVRHRVERPEVPDDPDPDLTLV